METISLFMLHSDVELRLTNCIKIAMIKMMSFRTVSVSFITEALKPVKKPSRYFIRVVIKAITITSSSPQFKGCPSPNYTTGHHKKINKHLISNKYSIEHKPDILEMY